MTEAMLAALVVLLTVMTTLVGVLLWVQWRSALTPKTAKAPESPQEPLAQQDPPSTPPMPFNDSNPPSWRVYRPSEGSRPRACTCHPDRLLVPGQNVLWWPLPSDGTVVLFCEDGVREHGGNAL